MARRRSNGDGSIFKRKDGRWCAKIAVAGKVRYKYARKERECRAWLKRVREEAGQGIVAEGGRQLVRDYLGEWLEAVRGPLAASTWRHYETRVRLHIAPYLGDMAIEELRPAHIQGLYRSLAGNGVGPSVLRHAHTTLHRALSHAVRLEILRRNPADNVDRPRGAVREMRVLDGDEVRRFLEVARGDRYEALWALALTTGMRQGELLGLRWGDIDFEAGVLRVQRQLQRVTGQGLVFQELKTKGSRRRIALGPEMVELLRAHYGGQGRGDLVFPSRVGTPLEGGRVRKRFKRLLDRAGLPHVRFHDLRHTSASLLLAANVHPKIVQERLGHADPRITLSLYSHLLPGLQEAAAERIEWASGMGPDSGD